jgi:hypothetical protein
MIDFDDFDEEVLPAHTRLSASGAERWMVCTASQQIAERLGLTGEETDEAAEGTAAHELGATCLGDGTEAWEHLGQEFYDHVVDEDMSLAVQVYLDECRYFTDKYPDYEAMIEVRVDNKDLHPDFGGTADWALVIPTVLFVKDYKHGIGISKSAVKNPQLRYYAYGVYMSLSEKEKALLEQIVLAIVQPRDFNPLGHVRTEIITPDELVAWAENELFPAMLKVDGPFEDLELKTGEHCRFCPAKIGCPTMRAMTEAAFKAKPEDAVKLTDEELSDEYEKIKVVRIYLKALQLEAFTRAKQGKKISSGKMVVGRFSRVFPKKAMTKVKTTFKDKAWGDRKLKSPAQIEKLAGGKAFVAANSHKIPGKQNFIPRDESGTEIKIDPPSKKFEGITKGPR